MKPLGAILVAAMLTCSSGCAKPDWIERTLVTVDVTGVWYGDAEAATGYARTDVRLDLKQGGPKVKGSMRARGPM